MPKTHAGRKYHGVLAMMPGFAKPGSDSLDAKDTVAVEALTTGVNRIVQDGIDLVAAGGSFGEGYSLLPEEFEVLTASTVAAVDGRVPLFIGCLGMSGREIDAKVRAASAAGARGVLVGLPNYFPLTTDNAVRFYLDVAERYPDLEIMIYHNPLLFGTRIPVQAFEEICQASNIVAMKDSHRETRAFVELMNIVPDTFSVFASARQYHPYYSLGAAGAWSYECWMGPAPMLRLRNAVESGDEDTAIQLIREIVNVDEGPADIRWRETASKLAVGAAGYCEPGPLRSPFVIVPQEVRDRAAARASYWKTLHHNHERALVAQSRNGAEAREERPVA